MGFGLNTKLLLMTLILVVFAASVSADFTLLGTDNYSLSTVALKDIIYIGDNTSLALHRQVSGDDGYAYTISFNGSYDSVIVDSLMYDNRGNIPRGYLIDANQSFHAYNDASVNKVAIISWNSSYGNLALEDSFSTGVGSYPVPVLINANTSILMAREETDDGYSHIIQWDEQNNLQLIGSQFEYDTSHHQMVGAYLLPEGNRTLAVGRGGVAGIKISVIEWQPDFTMQLKAQQYLIPGEDAAYTGMAPLDSTHAVITYKLTSTDWVATVLSWTADYSKFTMGSNLTFGLNYWCTYDIQNMNGSDFAFACEDQNNNDGYLYQLRVHANYTLSQISKQQIGAIGDYGRFDGMDKIDNYTLVYTYNNLATNAAIAYYSLPQPSIKTAAVPFNGSGTKGDPYQLENCSQLQNITDYNNTAYFQLNKDISCRNYTFTNPLGDFGGWIDGANHSITSFYLNKTPSVLKAECGIFRRIIDNPGEDYAYFHHLGFSNITVDCYDTGANGEDVGLIAGLHTGNYHFEEVSIKDSYVNGLGFVAAVVGRGANNRYQNFTDVYVSGVTVESGDTFGYGDFFKTSLIGNWWGSNLTNTWLNVNLISPYASGSCYAGQQQTGSTKAGANFDNQTCNISRYIKDGGEQYFTAEMQDPTSTIWDTYSRSVWHFEAGEYPVLLWEWEKTPRVTVISPNASVNSNDNDLLINYTVFDSDSATVDCHLYLDGSINLTDSGITPGSPQDFAILNAVDGSHSYSINCSDGVFYGSSDEFAFNVDTTAPQIYLINPGALNGSMHNYSFIASGNISDTDYLGSNYTIFYPNGSVLYNSVAQIWSTALNVSPFAGIYTIEAFAEDSFNNNASLDVFFYVNDTVPPICFGLTDADVYSDTAYTWAATCLDERLMYSFNMSCSGVSNYNYTEVGINTTTYSFNQSNTFANGSSSCSWVGCDGHTAKKLHKESWYIRDNKANTLEFEFKGKKNKIKTDDNALFTYKKAKDRIKFNISFTTKKATSYIFYYETSENSHYYPSEEFTAHIVDYGAKTWFDLNSPLDDFSIDVTPWNRTVWRIELIPDESRINNGKQGQPDVYEFHSIGELNCISGTQEFNSTVRVPGEEPLGTTEFREFASVPEALFYIFFYLVWFAFMLLTFIMKGRTGHTIQLFNILQGLMGIIIGIKFFIFSPFFAILTLMAAASIFLFKAVE